MKLFLILTVFFHAQLSWAQSALNVLTFNVYAKPDPINSRYTNERMERICETFKRGNWDVVLLQEVWTKGYRQQFRQCGFPHVMDLNRTGELGAEGHLGSGLMILSKYPLSEQKRLILSKPSFNFTSVSHGESLVDKSVYLAQTVLPSGEKIWLANTHLTANYCSDSIFTDCDSYDLERYQQASEAARFVKSQVGENAIVFGGDFNSGPHPFRNDSLWKKWGELFPNLVQAQYDTQSICTSCGTNFFKSTESGKIDHLFASKNLFFESGKVVLGEKFKSPRSGLELNLSDHYGWESRVVLGMPSVTSKAASK